MQYLYKVCFCCALSVVIYKVASAEKEDEKNEIEKEGDKLSYLYETMNRGEINPITKTRQKRSYEFLMGLINNNSRYQVTKDEPAINLSKKQGVLEKNFGASELLLELLVKIAANPEQWKNVHRLLRQLDQDILTSKQLMEVYRNHTKEIQNIIAGENLHLDQKKEHQEKSEDIIKSKKKYYQAEINKEIAITSDNGQPDINTELFVNPTTSTKEWPTFTNDISKVNFLNTDVSSNNRLLDHFKTTNIDLTTTKAYPKYFSYHRVTGKPVFINKSPKAYVAVSVVAPKSTDYHSKEDLELEQELRQLKPWTHSQNLKNMESIRSRWIIDSESNHKTSEKL